MFIVNHRKFFFVLSSILVLSSVIIVLVYGFNLGIDFKGGSLLEISYVIERPALETVKSDLDKLGLGTYILTPSADLRYILKTREITPAEKTEILSALSEITVVGGTATVNVAKEERFNSIGPVVGSQLKNKAMVAIIALAHDVIIPTGVFILWSHFYGGEIDLLFVTALLAILGYSVHDTIVVFDRVRENLRIAPKNETFSETVGESVNQTFGRSINTSLTIFLALIALYFIGGASTKDFAFVLIIGIITGTYSSIFVASPLLVTLERLQKKN